MKNCGPEGEPMCETSERGEKLFSGVEMLPIALDVGRRILEVFGYQELCKIVFRLKSNKTEIDDVINGDKLPSAELLLGIHKMTGVSIDWLLTGEGTKFRSAMTESSREQEATEKSPSQDRQPPQFSSKPPMHVNSPSGR